MWRPRELPLPAQLLQYLLLKVASNRLKRHDVPLHRSGLKLRLKRNKGCNKVHRLLLALGQQGYIGIRPVLPTEI